MTFTLAIVGRPNVGKSTLFNKARRQSGWRWSTTSPGWTRDLPRASAANGDLRLNVDRHGGLERGQPTTASRTDAHA